MEGLVKEELGFAVTSSAGEYLKHAIAGEENILGVRIAVRSSGCSGIKYDVQYAYEITDNDAVFEQSGVKVVIDKTILVKYLVGTELDFVREGMQEGLKFNNPREKGRCGCGESVTMDDN